MDIQSLCVHAKPCTADWSSATPTEAAGLEQRGKCVLRVMYSSYRVWMWVEEMQRGSQANPMGSNYYWRKNKLRTNYICQWYFRSCFVFLELVEQLADRQILWWQNEVLHLDGKLQDWWIKPQTLYKRCKEIKNVFQQLDVEGMSVCVPQSLQLSRGWRADEMHN